jgi:3-hydroxyisobutyrate dehydrogenase-like beta-hydroxyacid dehydrogenase
MPSQPRVAWIGLGRMGSSMARFIHKAGYPLTVWSRTASSRAALTAEGAAEAGSLAQCAAAADAIFCSVSDDAALAEVVLGPTGVLASARHGSILAETSTVSVEISMQIAREAAARGVDYLRMPISGNAASARTGNVTVMVSGPEQAWSRIKPVVETFSKAQIYLGAGEEARVMKLVVNSLIVNFAQSIAEALALGRKAGLDWSVMLDTLAESTLSSPWLKLKTGLLKQRDFSPTMTTRLILKDIDLMLSAARAHDVPMPLTANTRQLMQSAVGAGYGEEDYMAAVKLLERQSGLSDLPGKA